MYDTSSYTSKFPLVCYNPREIVMFENTLVINILQKCKLKIKIWSQSKYISLVIIFKSNIWRRLLLISNTNFKFFWFLNVYIFFIEIEKTRFMTKWQIQIYWMNLVLYFSYLNCKIIIEWEFFYNYKFKTIKITNQKVKK